jgi:hypothetical protein
MLWKRNLHLEGAELESTRAKMVQRSSYSLDRFLQEPELDNQELAPASSIEASFIDVTKIARRIKRMQSPTASIATFPAVAAPGAGRRPRLLLMGQRRCVFCLLPVMGLFG